MDSAEWVDMMPPAGGFGPGGGWKKQKLSDILWGYKIDLLTGTVVNKHGNIVKDRPTDTDDRENSYRQIDLRIPGGKRKRFTVHTLVSYYGHGPMPEHCSSVDHIDTNKTHNSKSNLRWSTAKGQAANRGERKKRKAAGPPPGPEPGAKLFPYMGSPGFVYTGPLLQFTEDGKVYRNGKLSLAESLLLGYPGINIKGLGMQKTHRIAWSAFYGPDAPVPEIINHGPKGKKCFAKNNLEDSNSSHNAIAAHNSGAYDGTGSQRQRVVIRLLLKPDKDWLFDSKNTAVFESHHAATKALVDAGACTLKNPQSNISRSVAKGRSFTVLVNNKPVKAFAAPAS